MAVDTASEVPEDLLKAAEGIVLDTDAYVDSQTEAEDDYVPPVATPSKPYSNKRNATSLGRRKIDIEFIDDRTKRHITFSKRKAGIMKKAYELATLTGTQVLLLVVSETGLVYTYTTPKLQPLVAARRGKALIQACLAVDDDQKSTSHEDDQSEANYTTAPPQSGAPSLAGIHEMASYTMPQSPPLPGTASLPTSPQHNPLHIPSQIPAFNYPYTSGTSTYPTMAYALPSDQMLNMPEVMSNGMIAHHPMPQAQPQSSPPMLKTVKRRKTTENLRKNQDRDTSTQTRLNAAQDQAAQALINAQYNPCLSTLFNAFNLQSEAQCMMQSSLVSVGPTLMELQMAISAINEPSNQHYPSIQLNSQVEALVPLYDFFFNVYLPGKQNLTKAKQEQIASDLLNFAGWLLGHNFVNVSIHASLLKLATPAPESRPSQELAAVVRSSSRSREDRATIMLAEYCIFASGRYAQYWETDFKAIEGTFLVLCVSSSFILLDDCALDADQEFIDATAPYKIRMPLCLNVLLRRGDTIHCRIAKVRGASFWLPTSSSAVTPAKQDMSMNYDPEVETRRKEVEMARQMDDQVAFSLASIALSKAERADALLEMGEFDDENFVPSEAKKSKLRRVQSSI